jgi:predicted ATPase
MAYLEPITIEKISLENFQSFQEKVEIPIKPLTFLFGPNSAGKSSIHDSMLLVNSILKNKKSEFINLYNKWLHTPKKTSKEHTIGEMVIEVQFSAWELLIGGRHGYHGDTINLPDEFKNSTELKELLSECYGPYDLKISIPPLFPDEYDITISACGLKIFRLYTPENGDGREIEFSSEIFAKAFTEMAARHNFESPKNSLCKVKCYAYNLENGLRIDNYFHSESYDRDLISIANHIIQCFVKSNFLPQAVSSDRSTIKNTELSELFISNGEFISAPIQLKESVNTHHSDSIQKISESKFKEFLSIKESNNDEYNLIDSLHYFVNQSLSHHLFLDQGYQIAFDIYELNPINETNKDKNAYGALLITYLTDNSGRRMTFEDVGTGMSCVLPVIIALDGWRSFIQQPELHLHPALQSALGDIFIEAINKNDSCRHIIETHSDYLLLRCLRRIRETSNGRISKNSKLKLQPTDVSVLYFDPQFDGTTKVKTIRVSTQGDFIDRWPRGFFEERGKDIFDE